MKKILVCATFLASAFFAKANQSENILSPCLYLQKAFDAQFGPVDDVVWHHTINNLNRADFRLEGKTYSAYFDEDDQYISTVRVITISDMPNTTFTKVKKMMQGYAITNVVEFWSDEKHVYFIEGRSKSMSKIFSTEASSKSDPLLTLAY